MPAWHRGGTLLSGQTGETLTLSPLQLTDAGSYWVQVTNPKGTVNSPSTYLAVLPIPASGSDLNLTNGLVLHLPFDSDYKDISGHSNNGTDVGGDLRHAGRGRGERSALFQRRRFQRLQVCNAWRAAGPAVRFDHGLYRFVLGASACQFHLHQPALLPRRHRFDVWYFVGSMAGSFSRPSGLKRWVATPTWGAAGRSPLAALPTA